MTAPWTATLNMTWARRAWTAVRGRRPCDIPDCGRAARCFGYCSRHMYHYRVGGA